ncbi:MAG TPA: hypothetical protein VLW17_06460 [Thermoanaerobaculaceae bacterium]|nr:hypothetical protein [Thermoanaerobaculaceae bacterium]
MTVVNTKRVWLGALVGWVVWVAWTSFVNLVVMMPLYTVAGQANQILKVPRYSFFVPVRFVILFVLALVCAWLYAGSRATRGAGPKTALSIGVAVGFASGFPLAFTLAAWATFSRYIALGCMLDLWVGAILATLVAGWLYRD